VCVVVGGWVSVWVGWRVVVFCQRFPNKSDKHEILRNFVRFGEWYFEALQEKFQ
jgi:hypothetical protein